MSASFRFTLRMDATASLRFLRPVAWPSPARCHFFHGAGAAAAMIHGGPTSVQAPQRINGPNLDVKSLVSIGVDWCRLVSIGVWCSVFELSAGVSSFKYLLISCQTSTKEYRFLARKLRQLSSCEHLWQASWSIRACNTPNLSFLRTSW